MKKLYICAMFVFITGCTGSRYYVKEMGSHAAEFSICRMKKNFVCSCLKERITAKTKVEFNAERCWKKGEGYDLNFIIVYKSPKLMMIKKGESLIISIDGERMVLKGPGSFSDRKVYKNLFVERAWYSIDTEQIRKLAFAKKAKIAVIGEKKSLVRKLSGKNIKNLRRFYDEYVEPKLSSINSNDRDSSVN